MRVGFIAVLLLIAAPVAAQEFFEPRAQLGAGAVEASVRTEDVAVRLFGVPSPELGEDWLLPVAEVDFRGERVARLTSEGANARMWAAVTIVEMDPASDTPEVVLEAYTGGAHCCTEVIVATKAGPGGWTIVPVGMFDGGSSVLADIGYDGRFEIATRNNDFLYAFDGYAGSAAPLQILAVEAGAVKDATFDPRHREHHREYLASLEEGVDFEEAGNGFLADWVAQKAILGEGREAWARMLDAYDPENTWMLETCRTAGDLDACAEGDRITRSFPDALKDFLDERGFRL